MCYEFQCSYAATTLWRLLLSQFGEINYSIVRALGHTLFRIRHDSKSCCFQSLLGIPQTDTGTHEHLVIECSDTITGNS
jgi:hypothetical protein